MRRLRLPRATLASVSRAAAVVALALGSAACHPDTEAERERENPRPVASRVSHDRGESVIRLDAGERARAEIAVLPIAEVSRRSLVQAYGQVLDLTELAALRERFAAAQADVAKAEASLDASAREYERMAALNRDDKNVSDRAVEAAAATRRADEASAAAARSALRTLAAQARQQWGEAIQRWLAEETADLRRLFELREVLVRVTPASAGFLEPPRFASLELSAGGHAQAELVSPLATVDPRTQRNSYLYRAPAATGLLPGASISATLASGTDAQGALIPPQALVWWQGKAWFYVERKPGEFERRELAVDQPIEGGWLAGASAKAGESAVVAGAQLLLSEELRAGGSAGEGEPGETD